MSPKVAAKRSRSMSAPERAQKAMSLEARAMYAEVQQCVKQLDKSIGEVERGVRKAEHELEAAARVRIRELRKDARIQLSVLKSKQREAASTLKLVPPTPGGGTWDDIKHTVDSVLVDARSTASAAVNWVRHPWGG